MERSRTKSSLMAGRFASPEVACEAWYLSAGRTGTTSSSEWSGQGRSRRCAGRAFQRRLDVGVRIAVVVLAGGIAWLLRRNSVRNNR